MKIFALEILVCLIIGILGLQAATGVIIPVQVSEIVLEGNDDDQWLIIGNGKVYDLRHVSITGMDRKGNLIRVNLDQMGDATLPQIVAYLKKLGVSLRQ